MPLTTDPNDPRLKHGGEDTEPGSQWEVDFCSKKTPLHPEFEGKTTLRTTPKGVQNLDPCHPASLKPCKYSHNGLRQTLRY
jgi:hypothetical protein